MIYFKIKTRQQLYIIKKNGSRLGLFALICPAQICAEARKMFDGETIEIYADLPDIARENTMDRLEAMINELISEKTVCGVVIKNVDELGLMTKLKYKGKVLADPLLYAYNRSAQDLYKSVFDNIRFISSDELSDAEIMKMAEASAQIFKIYGRAKVMLTAQNISDNYTAGCEKVTLQSVKHDKFICTNETFGYTTVYTNEPVSVLDKDYSFFKDQMIDFTTENAKECQNVIDVFIDPSNAVLDETVTFGHHYKGID